MRRCHLGVTVARFFAFFVLAESLRLDADQVIEYGAERTLGEVPVAPRDALE